VFYIERDYLVISLPMKPWDQGAASATGSAPAKGKPKQKKK
jgi:hypothetical protein